ncbi:hypothetical protein TVAG_067450 [Trichomonas vaginalis G3]|uniref:UBZ4-type domain-containing protein n=1 Tax=Trichomonas vaginalis (strain ATCC PRA-98 / G3) TaxID=412133 RepID=A2DSG1_TRIV3|nr:hypothetical protein TVAGG3_0080040 [Trichomonas vaginalis G3]EAY16740.1 hypothetical protein TVAG_067450 [Trichomonas vaginalis G3]KAI5543181.1 hypothetical protein TVAGG3_0080040 [Trichomonas vaginalis G3]|eukprot:XP_001328963.1 hypothetical protein [Trichomonas vaginalis G3]
MTLSDDDEGFYCPICNADLTEQDSMWRQVHINNCLAKEGKPEEKPCQVQLCPICNMDLTHVSAKIAESHINHCLDSQAQKNSIKRTSDRCPYCGANLKGLTERQKKVHQQMCRETEKATDSSIYQYPKVVETLETPAEWEVAQEVGPITVDSKLPNPKNEEEIPIFGEVFTTDQLQFVDKHFYSNLPNIAK